MPFGRARDLDMYDICATECQIFVKYGINVLKKIPHMARFKTICIYHKAKLFLEATKTGSNWPGVLNRLVPCI